MLSGKSRPVPSKAALKVLYQLAYISSGTAVGVAALCAEERRRRTQLVQKIADNAKRIRQSPRYYQNAAFTSQEADDYGADHGGAEGALEWQHARRGKRGQTQPGHHERAIRGPELPSVVEDAYAKAHHQDGRLSSRTTERRRPLRTTDITQGMTVAAREVEVVRTHGAAGRTSRSSPPRGTARLVDAETGFTKRPPGWQDNLAYKTFKRTSPKAHSPLVPESSGSPPIARRNSHPPALHPDISKGFRDDEFRTRPAWRRSSDDLLSTDKLAANARHVDFLPEDISHDVGQFFEGIGAHDTKPRLLHKSTRVANQLLRVALELGQLDDIRSLYLWKLSSDVYTELDAQILCGACRSLSLRMDQGALLEFYSDMFHERRFQRLDIQRRLQLGLYVLTEALGWAVHSTLRVSARGFFDPMLDESSRKALTQLLSEKCRELRAGGLVQRAADLIVSLHSFCSECQEFTVIIDTIFKAALEAGSLSSGAKLLRLASTLKTGVMHEYYETFLVACDTQGAYGSIVELFGAKRRMRQLKGVVLSSKSYEIIAVACTKADEMTPWIATCFKMAHQRVPDAMRGRIVQSRSHLRLNMLWRSTHNLARVRQEIRSTAGWLQQHGSEEVQRAWKLCELEIYISANQLDLALSTIARIHGTQPVNGHTVSLAAVLFAKKGAWDSLERLLAVARDSDMIKFDADITKRFNNVFRLHSREHSGEETWKFVSAAMNDLGFSPNQATTEIVLESFVAQKSIGLIPKWLRYLQILGHRFELSARVAAKLLTRFYLDHRPSHVLIMSFCRNLAYLAPSLAGPEFTDLVKEAIGYDIRKASASHTEPQVQPVLIRERDREVRGAASNTAGVVVDSTARLSEGPGIPPGVQTLDKLPFSVGKSAIANAEAAQPKVAAALDVEPPWDAADAAAPGLVLGTPDSELPSMIQFEDLRTMYTAEDSDTVVQRPEHSEYTDVPELQAPSFEHQTLERDMILAMSLAQYAKVAELYSSSLDAAALPASPLALEVAVEASLRHHRGDRTDAEDMMRQARDAGMNVTCAMGPLLIQQMYHLKSTDKNDVNNLRVSVIEYYRMNDENGWPVKHHVGITAANLLINSRRAEHGLNILDAIYRSEWAVKRPLDIVAMTVFLKGYAALRSIEGIKWVVKTVLTEDMRVDQKFLAALRDAMKRFTRISQSAVPVRPGGANGKNARLVPVLVDWIQQCHERRAKQRFEAKVLGRKLVACLAKCANQQQEPGIEAAARHALEDAIFGQRVKALNLPSDVDSDSAVTPTTNRYLERLKLRVAREIRAEHVHQRRGPRARALGAYDRRWLVQYRAFLRRNLVMPGGKLAAFRYRLADEPEDSLARRQTSDGAGHGTRLTADFNEELTG
ncbi:hypothetical protein LTR65_006111 [Meristemomyces frigidus]